VSRLFNLFKASVGIKKEETTKTVVDGHTIEVGRVDANLPLNLRIGSLASFPESRLLVVQTLGSVINVSAKSQDSKVQAIGSYKIGDHKLYRAYITLQPEDNEFIQILTHTDLEGKVVVDEAILFSSFFFDYPQDDEGWQYYRDAFNSETYTNPEGNEYNRVTMGETKTRFTLVYSADGEKGADVEIEYQLWERGLTDDSSEFVLIEVFDMVETDQATVKFYTGIPLNINDIKFIPTN
jgi:hypothetical protein